MKDEYTEMDFHTFLHSVKKVFLQNEEEISFCILTWQDAANFEESCEDDGGIIQEHLDFFNNLPFSTGIKCFEDLVKELLPAKSIPYLTSQNGNYKLFYDIYVWVGRYYWCYNVYREKVFHRKFNFFQKLTGIGTEPPWKKMDYDISPYGYIEYHFP